MSELLRLEYIPLARAVGWDWEENQKLHDLGALWASIERYGFQDPPKFDAALDRFVYGNGRVKALAWGFKQGQDVPAGIALDETNGGWAVPVVFGNDLVSKAIAEAFTLDHNNLTMAGGDFAPWDIAQMWDTEGYLAQLQALAEMGELPVSVDGDDLDGLLAELGEIELPPAAETELTRTDVPDALWPSDNEWGIPLLDASLQAQAVDLPVALWGATGRKKRMGGTWLFYCDDYRFEALWRDPSGVPNTRCASVVEPNFTIGPQTPRAVALWQIYRKRYLARWWQSCGVRVLVDLNVDTVVFGDIMLLGVPKGWRAYATRGYTARREFTVAEYELACSHAGTEDLLFLLYGGGKACQELARERGWVYVSEHMDVKRGGVVDG